MAVNLNSVLISDPVDDQCAKLLTRYEIDVTTKYKLSKEELIEELQKHDGLIVRSETKVTADVIAAAPNLKMIGRAGTGVDNIDVPAATRQGILVLNTPGGNSTSACELTCAMIMALARNVVQAGQSMREGRWDRKVYAGRELEGKCLGVLGFGRIGREVAARMKAFGMKVLAYDPLLTPGQFRELGVDNASVDGVLERADYITVHTPLIKETKDLLNGKNMLKCKKGFCVVNVARGGIISESGLLSVLESGHCGGAGLDVFTEEPPKSATLLKLIQHPKVIATPHLGASTAEAQTRVAVEIAEHFLTLSGRTDEFPITGIVNAPSLVAANNPTNAPWVDLARKLGIIASKFIGSKNRNIVVDYCVCGGEDKKYVKTALLLGLLTGRVKGELNLINAQNLADELKIKVNEQSWSDCENVLFVKAGGHEVKGSLACDSSKLMSVDNTQFKDYVCLLQDNISLYKTKTPEDLTKIVSSHINKSVTISSVSVSGNWVVMQTNNPVTIPIDGIESY
ncbi:uncharacterized protein LOC106645125 isoform X3 [Copidosoma floridanum]|uniref:uncharacterized protein LOC106645125 isoform X3 n=1 Tax=Copidosoma floridanum TaxID=29053 RepID=UPI0006C9AB56|nr:uncharacterized protein LOC106645125 isoform X3 [Copidosoma floridanum]